MNRYNMFEVVTTKVGSKKEIVGIARIGEGKIGIAFLKHEDEIFPCVPDLILTGDELNEEIITDKGKGIDLSIIRHFVVDAMSDPAKYRR